MLKACSGMRSRILEMTIVFLKKAGSWTLILSVLAAGPVWADSHISKEDRVVVVTLTQSPCLFVEAEAKPKNYHSKQAADCVAINKQTINEREFNPLRLAPGRVIFRVTNKNVPYELGFWVRGQGLGRATLPSASGGGLLTGQTKDYGITLKKGSYWYSCLVFSS